MLMGRDWTRTWYAQRDIPNAFFLAYIVLVILLSLLTIVNFNLFHDARPEYFLRGALAEKEYLTFCPVMNETARDEYFNCAVNTPFNETLMRRCCS